MSAEYVIISGVRTPFGKFGGSLKDIHVIDLGAMVIKEAIKRANLKPEQVDEVWWGCGDTSNTEDVFTPVVGRQSLLEAGLSPYTPCCMFDKACISGTSAVHYGIRTLKAGDADIVLAGGATHFSSVPFLFRNMPWNEIAVEYGISGEEQDEFVLDSHKRYSKAWEEGFFKSEMMPIEIKQQDGSIKVLDIDEQYRPNASIVEAAQLDTIFNMGGIRAENALGLNDGAVALILTTREKADAMGIKPIATIVTTVSVGADPRKLPIAPAVAIGKAFEKTGLTIDDMDIIEINEAFACIPLVSSKILAGRDEAKYKKIMNKLNVNGSIISNGNTNYASGARIILTMCHELKRRGGGIGVMGICGGLTQGDAAIIKVEP